MITESHFLQRGSPEPKQSLSTTVNFASLLCVYGSDIDEPARPPTPQLHGLRDEHDAVRALPAERELYGRDEHGTRVFTRNLMPGHRAPESPSLASFPSSGSTSHQYFFTRPKKLCRSEWAEFAAWMGRMQMLAGWRGANVR
jgi:hypothetical protein